MILTMAGMDWTTAGVERREALSFTQHQVTRLCRGIAEQEGVSGCVLLATCNRTELYVTSEGACDPAQLLCQLAGAPSATALFQTLRGEEAARHLMRVACGLRSQIFGEDQIVSQVKRAYLLAHEAGTVNAELSQLFRLAVTAGKSSRSSTHLRAAPLSVAGRGVELLEQAAGSLQGKRALVIGNGEMGRLASSLLVQRGCQVVVTLRSYRHGHTIVPPGCETIAYDRRYESIPSCDLLLSATTSPHYTIMADRLAALPHVPPLLCDLAMPRDIDPESAKLPGVTLFDMDSMTNADERVDAGQLAAVERIIDEQLAEYARWKDYRAALPLVNELSELTAQRVEMSYDFDLLCAGEGAETVKKMELAARLAAEKTARLLLSGLQGVWDEKALEQCRGAILRKAPQLRTEQVTE